MGSDWVKLQLKMHTVEQRPMHWFNHNIKGFEEIDNRCGQIFIFGNVIQKLIDVLIN